MPPTSKQRDYDYLFKLVLIGDSGVGKSCLLLRFAVRIRNLTRRNCDIHDVHDAFIHCRHLLHVSE